MNDINFSVYKNTLKRTDGFSPVSGEGNYTRLIFHFRPGDDWDNCTAVTVSYYKGNRSATHSNTAVSDGTATFTVPDEVIRPDHKIYFCLQGSYTEGSVQRTIVTNVIALNVNRGYIVEEGAAQNVYESLLAAVNQIAAAKANAADVTAALALKANAADVYTKTEADSGFASKSGFDTFVTETYADDMTDLEDAIDLKANSSDVAAALALKANAADVYTKTEADAGFASKAGFNTFVTETYADDMTDLEDAIDLKANSSDVAAALALKANAAEVYTKTETDTALVKKVNAAEVDYTITKITGCHREEIGKSGYITTDEPITSLEPTPHNKWCCEVISCEPGDVFTVYTKGDSHKLAWVFLDNSNAKLTPSAKPNTDVNDAVITAPEGAVKLIINANVNSVEPYCFRGKLTVKSIEDIISSLVLKANAADVSAALALKANAAEVYTKTETDTALAKKENAAEVDYTITKITGCHREEIGKSGYITTDEPITSLEPNPHSKWRCEVISCEPGDVFTVYTKGDSHKLAWVFLDNSNAKLTPSAKPNTDVNDAVITAPEGAVKLIINANVNSVEPYCFRGNLTDILSSLALKANSSDIPSKTSDLTNDSGFIAAHQSDLPSYYDTYLAGMINDINTMIDNSGNGDDTLLFITDYHRQSNCKNSPAIIRRLMDWTSIKAVFFGGDAQDFETTAGAAIAENDGFKADFEKLWDRMYNIIGNHEFNSHYEAAALTQQQIKLFFIRQQAASYGAVNTYGDYWVDNTAQKIRYFFIGCKENSTIDKEQLKWLFNEFLSVPADYLIVVFSHLTFKHVDEDRTKIFVQGNVSTVAKMMTKYNLRDDSASVTFNFTDEYDAQQSETVTYNYGSAGAWCAAIIGGHTHYDADTTYENLSKKVNNAWVTDSWQYHIPNTETYVDLVPVISTTTDAAQKQQDNTGTLTRTPGTVSEQAFDVIHIDRANHKLIFKRIGAGTNREITYPGPAQNAQPQEV